VISFPIALPIDALFICMDDVHPMLKRFFFESRVSEMLSVPESQLVGSKTVLVSTQAVRFDSIGSNG
jgi:hypothetical protein